MDYKKFHSAIGSKLWEIRFLVFTFQTKKTACNYLYPFSSFRTQKFCGQTNGRTLTESFCFSSWSRIHIHVYIYLDYFSNFPSLWSKLVIPLFSVEMRDQRFSSPEDTVGVFRNHVLELSQTEWKTNTNDGRTSKHY